MHRAPPATRGITPNTTGIEQSRLDSASVSPRQTAFNLARQLSISAPGSLGSLSVAGATPRETANNIRNRFQSLHACADELSHELSQSIDNVDLLPFVEQQRSTYEDLLKNLRELPINLREASFKPGSVRSLVLQIEKLLSVEARLRRIVWEADSTETRIKDVGYLKLVENLKPFLETTHKRIDNLIDLYAQSEVGETHFLFTAAVEAFATLYQACSRATMYLEIDTAESQTDRVNPQHQSLGDVQEYLKQFAAMVFSNIQKATSTPTENGIYCRIEKPSFERYTNTLPMVGQLKDVSLTGLLYTIELKPENPDGSTNSARQDAQHKAIQHFELLIDLCEKCEHIVKTVCTAENWTDLLERSPRQSPSARNGQQTPPAQAENDEQVSTDTVKESENRATDVNKRIQGLLEKADKLGNENPFAILSATSKNQGIYSPEFIQHIRHTFCKVAEKNCEAMMQLVQKIQTEINRKSCQEPLRKQLEETVATLQAKVANLQTEIEYSRSEGFLFHTLKSYSLPKEKHWKSLLDSNQIEHIDLIRNPETDAPRDHLYQFKLTPVAPQGTDYEPVWLHVHLAKAIHVLRQWQALQTSDVSAAHLKSNLNHHRGAKWQENQRHNGNHYAVVQRSPVSLEFVKEIAGVVVTQKPVNSKNKTRGKRN